jgi:hypothetical protein
VGSGVLLEHLAAAIGGPVVDGDHIEPFLPDGLADEGVQAGPQIVDGVVDGDDDGDLRGDGHGRVRSG